MSQNLIVPIEPQVSHIEDEQKVASFIKKHVEVSMYVNGYVLMPQLNNYPNYANFETAFKKLSPSHLEYCTSIIDLHLGNDENEGIQAIKLWNSRENDIKPIVYSAHGSEVIRLECKGLGVNEERFIEKLETGSFSADIEKIIELLKTDYKTILEKDKYFNLLVANGKVSKKYEIRGTTLHVTHSKKIRTFESHFYWFSYWTTPVKIGDNYLSFNKHFEHFKISNEVLDEADFIAQIIDKNGQDVVEGITFCLNQLKIYVCLPDFETFKNAVDSVYKKVNSKDNYALRLLDFFMAQRLYKLFLQAESEKKDNLSQALKQQEELLEFSNRIKYLESKMALVCAFWEAKHRGYIEGEIPEFPVGFNIIDVFLCEVEKIEEEDDEAEVKLLDIKDKETPIFYRTFNLGILNKYGIYNTNARFKLVLYSKVDLPGESFAILPVSPNVNF